MGRGRVIRLLPFDQAEGHPPVAVAADGSDPLAWARRRCFTPSGRAALDAVLGHLALDPADDVLITNSSGQTWVSACVTCIVFNHCRPSRVLTGRTRAIVVIHEYGYPHPRLDELLDTARRRGIPLVEDCAHSLDSTLGGAPLGSFGDYAIFSLSKVLPVASGGILVAANELPSRLHDDDDVKAGYREHVPGLPAYSRRRRENYDAVRRRFPELPLLLEAAPGVTPFIVALLVPDAAEVRRRSAAIEWGSTLRDDLLLVTTNPLVEPQALTLALEGALSPGVPT